MGTIFASQIEVNDNFLCNIVPLYSLFNNQYNYVSQCTDQREMKAKYKRVTAKIAAEIKCLHQVCRIRGRKLLDHFPGYSKANIYKHAKQQIGCNYSDGRKKNKGRPVKVNDVMRRRIIREVPRLVDLDEDFTSQEIQHSCNANDVSNRTVRRILNRAGYKYLRLRKKGVLMKTDLKKRDQFAKRCKKLLSPDFWKVGISIYLDGVGFEYKQNPYCSSRVRSLGWRKRSTGLDFGHTTKGKKTGKRNAYFYVGISYSKGVVNCIPYIGAMNGERYIDTVIPKLEEGFEASINPIAKRLLQDNCPVMNAACVVQSLDESGTMRFPIPARSPDLNPIENIFAAIRRKLKTDAKVQNIQSETFAQFQKRAQNTISNFSQAAIDKVIESMWNRIQLVIERGGQRIRY